MENTIASLIDLPKPTGRMPFHLSPDGRQLAIGVQRRTTAHEDRDLTSGVFLRKWPAVPWSSWIQLPGSRCGLFQKTARVGVLSGRQRATGWWPACGTKEWHVWACGMLARGRLSCCGMRLF